MSQTPAQPGSPFPQGGARDVLRAAGAGDSSGSEKLLAAVYDELRRLAQSYLGGERAGHTLTATALVHEAYLKLAGAGRLPGERSVFLASAAQAMRRILVDHARARKALKRGGSGARVALDDAMAWFEERRIDLPGLDAALSRLAERDARKARVVELRFFAGLTMEQVAEVLGTPRRTVERDWTLARAWLKRALREAGDPSTGSAVP